MAGFDKLKTATSGTDGLGRDREAETQKNYDKVKFGPKHQEHYAWLIDHGYARPGRK